MRSLEPGQEIVITLEVLQDQAKYGLDSGFGAVRRSDIKRVVDEIDSDQYPDYRMLERYDRGDWILKRVVKRVVERVREYGDRPLKKGEL